MKAMRAGVVLIGWLAGFSVEAEQPYGLQQYGAGAEDDGARGLLGSYPVNRDAPGTGWQPDSTPADYRQSRSNALGGGADLFGENVSLIYRTQNGSAFGLQAAVTVDALRRRGVTSFLFDDANGDSMRMPGYPHLYRRSPVSLAATYSMPLSRASSVFGYMGLSGEPAYGPPTSYARRFSSMEDPNTPFVSNWLESSNAGSNVITLGYVWRNLKVEGSAFSRREAEQKRDRPQWYKRDSYSRRLSFNPTPNWALQVSRGHLSSLDQLEPDRYIRRTTISATYNRTFSDVNWQTTLAWGRSSREQQESTNGYLVESTLKLRNLHAFFGRLEQVGSDDLLREDQSVNRRIFKMNKVTVGYVYDVQPRGPVKYDVGALMSRHLVPSGMTPAYGEDPTSYMMFVRLRLD